MASTPAILRRLGLHSKGVSPDLPLPSEVQKEDLPRFEPDSPAPAPSHNLGHALSHILGPDLNPKKNPGK